MQKKYWIIILVLTFVFGNFCFAQDDLGFDPSDFDEPKQSEEKTKDKPDKKKEELGLDPSDFENGEETETEESEEEIDKIDSPGAPEDSGQRAKAPVRLDEYRNTHYLIISGSIATYFIFRDDFFNDALAGTNSNNLDEDFFDPRATLQIDARLDRNVRGVLQLQNESRVEDVRYKTSLGTLHITNRSEDNAFRLEVEKAYLEFSDFLLDGFTFQTGIIPHRYSLRADGQAFFLDLQEAESPYTSREDTHAIGALFSYKPIKQIDFVTEGYFLVTSESGFGRRDEIISGINIDLNMSKDALRESDEEEITLVRLFNLNFAAIQGDNNTPIWHIGGGFSYFMLDGPEINYTIELFGEVFFQFGEYDRKNLAPVFSNRDQDHLALGGYGGFKWLSRKGNWKPFFEISYWYLSGDDDDVNSDLNRDPVTFENIDSTLIIEDNDYGLDIDSNYWAVKCQVGSHLPIAEEIIYMSLIYAHFERVDTSSARAKRLGEEIDFRITWEYTPQVIFSTAAGVLWDSKYLKDYFDELGARGKEHAFLLRLETSLLF